MQKFQRGQTNKCVRTGPFLPHQSKMGLLGQEMDRSGHIYWSDHSETSIFLSQLFKTHLLRLVSAFQDIWFQFYSILKFILGELGPFGYLLGRSRPIHWSNLSNTITFLSQLFKTNLLRLVSPFQDIWFQFYSLLKFALGETGHFRHSTGPVRLIHWSNLSETITFLSQLFKTNLLRLV